MMHFLFCLIISYEATVVPLDSHPPWSRRPSLTMSIQDILALWVTCYFEDVWFDNLFFFIIQMQIRIFNMRCCVTKFSSRALNYAKVQEKWWKKWRWLEMSQSEGVFRGKFICSKLRLHIVMDDPFVQSFFLPD